MQRRMIVWCAAMAVALWSGRANATDASYSFAFGTTNYRVAPGKKVDIPVYLQETVGSGTSALNANGVGMFGAGVALSFSSSSSSPASVLTTAGITANAAFNSTADRRTEVTSTTADVVGGDGLFEFCPRGRCDAEPIEVPDDDWNVSVYRGHGVGETSRRSPRAAIRWGTSTLPAAILSH